MSPQIAVILVHYGDHLATTLRCIQSLKKEDLFLLVIDQNEEQSLIEMTQTQLEQYNEIQILPLGDLPKGAGIYWLFRHSNQGYGGGMNLGVHIAAQAKANYSLLLNNDVVAPPGFIADFYSQVTEPLQQGDFGAAGCLIRYYKTPEIWFAGGNFNQTRCMGEHLTEEPKNPNPQETGFLTGCCMLVKTEDYLQIGGMAEEYFLYFEDVDLGLQLQKAGKKLWFCPSPELQHDVGSATGGESSPLVIYYSTRNRLWLMRKRASLWGFGKVFLFFVCSRLIYFVLWGFLGRGQALAALCRGFVHGLFAKPNKDLRF